MKHIWKLLYIFSKTTAFSGLPGLRKVRNQIYSRYLGGAGDLNVSDFVIIRKAHTNKATSFTTGNGLRVGAHAEIDYSGGITIGKNVTVSEGARIFTHDHEVDGHADWRKNPINFSPLTVDDFAWVGANSIILNSVSTIGKGAVIAAGAVVNKNVDDYEIVGGVPASRLRIRRIDDQNETN